MTIAAIDQGTTSTRLLLVNEGQEPRIAASRNHRHRHPGVDRSEQDADELLANVEACAQLALDAGAEAIGIDNQGESCLAWDARTGRPICPVLVWEDSRTDAEVRAIAEAGHGDFVKQTTGLPLDSYFSASKLGWIMRNVPEAKTLAREKRLRLGTTDAFFRDRLTGAFETDIATASRTSLLDLRTGDWDDRLCDLFGVPRECLPTITPTHGALGDITIVSRSLPMTASIVDQQAALYGHGCRRPGEAKITVGTGAFVQALVGDSPRLDTAALATIAWQKTGEPAVHALDGGVYAAASAINWCRSLNLFDGFEEIDGFNGPTAIEAGTVFVPALHGLACPHWNRAARGAWFGLSGATTRQTMMQAVLEGIAFRIAEVVRCMSEAVDLKAPVSIDGGVTRNRYFCEFLATVMQSGVRISGNSEATALGTAMLAGEGFGRPMADTIRGETVHPKDCPDRWRDRFSEAVACVEAFGKVTGADG